MKISSLQYIYKHTNIIFIYNICIRKQRSYTHIHKETERLFCCVNCHNARNLYHIRVIDIYTIECFWIFVLYVYNTYINEYIYIFICYLFQAEVKLEYLLNLSILISKGKEINWDCLSNGEWTGKSSLLKRVKFTFDMHCGI